MSNLASLTEELYDVNERLLVEENNWYVRTREIPQLGPFGTREEAITGLYQHVDLWNRPEPVKTFTLMPVSTVHRLDSCNIPECGLCAELALLRDCSIPRPSIR